ncbi:Zn(2)-C6 fungal-type domain-containing protein [Mycena venus]|uniref:Zn(2)-C6 fungal-type domain-containing protein n=1 Tax=Mycena venus TaxID=2733690 RepID=A0A8H7CP58_9AGAR|nr:Zn(2)-C6 fungal-type domain-containing protein [Mycena venus]
MSTALIFFRANHGAQIDLLTGFFAPGSPKIFLTLAESPDVAEAQKKLDCDVTYAIPSLSIMASTSRQSPDRGKLPRGQACFNCRRRKRKCDGNLPCSQCSHLNIEDDCEYTDGGKRSIAHILQEDIDRLENRIHYLEHPHQPKLEPTLPLHQPYHGSISRSGSSTPRPTHHRSTSRSGSAAPSQTWITASEPPRELIEQLIDNFLPYSSEFGFFLDYSRFRQAALLPLQMGHHSRPSAALLSAIYLWGLRLSGQPSLTAQEPAFLARALNLTSKGLSDTHPQRVMHTLQAEVLLSYFFFASGRALEGKYHTSGAISLSLSSSLHLIRSQNRSSPGILHPPADTIEEGERIQAWWTVMILDSCWAVGLCETPGFAHRDSVAMVDTPWPLESDDYAKGYPSANTRYSQTIQNFTNEVPTSDTGMSTVAMLAKASILWLRADELARGWKPGMTAQMAGSFSTDFKRLDALIDRFRESLVPPNQILRPTPAMTRALVVAHSIAHSATVRLHSLFAQTDITAKRKRLAAARSVLGIIAAVPLRHFKYINPIMGTVWVAAVGVFLEEIRALRALHAGPPREEELNLRAFLSRAVVAILAFETTSPLLHSQLSPMRQNCAQIGIAI